VPGGRERHHRPGSGPEGEGFPVGADELGVRVLGVRSEVVIDWTQATDVELGVLWYALHFDDGLFYGFADDKEEAKVGGAVDSEVQRRGLTESRLLELSSQ
jgi:hypothetical protein